jgi:glyoxylase-like metal-dependent hydrolase (beta-lactamase superfamily II)
MIGNDKSMRDRRPAEMIHEILPVGMLQCNCHILGDPVTREALVIDPGDEVDRILELLAKHALRVRAIVSTHAHIDHVGGLAKMQQVTGAPVLMHGDDLDLYRHLDEQAAWLGTRAPDPAKIDQSLREGDTLRWGPYSAQVLHTPGHTRGSLSLYLPAIHLSGPDVPTAVPASDRAIDQASDSSSAPNVLKSRSQNVATSETGKLFAGDTLFASSIGRTDLWGGSLPQILRSIRDKIMVLPEDTIVYPGHGPLTTIGQERATNPFLQASFQTGVLHQLGGKS